MKVVYGHTDSIYVTIDSIERGKEIVSILNEKMREKFPNVMGLEEHPVTLEFEKYYKSLGVGATKNRNAGLITWKDGKHLEETEFTMTGFTAKRASETKLAKEVQINTLKMWVNGRNKKDITVYLNNVYSKVLLGKVELGNLAKRSRYKEERFKVKCVNCFRKSSLFNLMTKKCCNRMNIQTMEGKRPSIGSGIEGIIFYNSTHDNPITDSYICVKVSYVNDKYMHPIYQVLTEPSYFSANTIAELNNLIIKHGSVDYKHYANTVVKKAEPIFNAMGWDSKDISKDKRQKEIEDWF